MKNIITILIISVILSACSSNNRNIIFVADTGMGAKIAQNPESQMYEASFGLLYNYVSIVPVQLNTQNPTNEDASNCASLMSSLDLLIDWNTIEMHNKFIINGKGNQPDSESVKHLMTSQSVKFANEE